MTVSEKAFLSGVLFVAEVFLDLGKLFKQPLS